jgi:hypothetical protein
MKNANHTGSETDINQCRVLWIILLFQGNKKINQVKKAG